MTRTDTRDQGFTLIELLVVIIIIGVLSSIAVPVFLNQRKKAVDASIKTDLKNVATAVETWMVDHPQDTDGPGTELAHVTNYNFTTRALNGSTLTFDDGTVVQLSPGNFIEIYGYNNNMYNSEGLRGYCISGANRNSSKGWTPTSTGQPNGASLFFYDSRVGGLTTSQFDYC